MYYNEIFEDFSIKVNPEAMTREIIEHLDFLYESINMDIEVADTYLVSESLMETIKYKIKLYISKAIEFFVNLADRLSEFLNLVKTKFVESRLVENYKSKFMNESNNEASSFDSLITTLNTNIEASIGSDTLTIIDFRNKDVTKYNPIAYDRISQDLSRAVLQNDEMPIKRSYDSAFATPEFKRVLCRIKEKNEENITSSTYLDDDVMKRYTFSEEFKFSTNHTKNIYYLKRVNTLYNGLYDMSMDVKKSLNDISKKLESLSDSIEKNVDNSELNANVKNVFYVFKDMIKNDQSTAMGVMNIIKGSITRVNKIREICTRFVAPVNTTKLQTA